MRTVQYDEDEIYAGHKETFDVFVNYSYPSFGTRAFASRLKRMIVSSKRPRVPQWIFIACMLKSGSTYISGKVSNITGYEFNRPLIYFHDIEQNIDMRRADHLLNKRIVCQMETPGKLFNIEIMKRYNIKPIILIRDPRDVILSLHDHLQKESPITPFGRIGPEWYEQEYERRIDYLLYHFLPSIIAWYRTWFQNKHHLEHLVVKYEDLLLSEESKGQLFRDILYFYGLDELAAGLDKLPPDSPWELRRLNVAKLDRWRDEMNHHHLALFDKISGDTLKLLGYSS